MQDKDIKPSSLEISWKMKELMYIVSPSVCQLPVAAAAHELAKSILNCL